MTDYRNEASLGEREQILRNDQRVRSGSTFFDHTHSEEGGRFAKPTNVIGSTPTVQYPRLPENSWTNDPVPPEAPLGIDVNAIEPVGESFEVAASLQALGDATEAVAQSSPLAGATATPVSNDPSLTGGAEAPSEVLAPADGEPPAIPPLPEPLREPKRRSPR